MWPYPQNSEGLAMFYGGQDSEEWGSTDAEAFYPTVPTDFMPQGVPNHVFHQLNVLSVPFDRILPVHQQDQRTMSFDNAQHELREQNLMPLIPNISHSPRRSFGIPTTRWEQPPPAITSINAQSRVAQEHGAFHVWSDSDIAPSAILDHSQYMHAPIDVSQDYGALRDVRHSSDYSISPLSSPSSPSAHTTADGIPSLLPLGIDCQWQNCTAHIPCRTYQAIQAHLKDAHLDSRGTPWKERRRIEGRCMWGGCAANPMLYQSLAKHIASTHLGATRVACRYGCGKTQSRKSELERHYRTCPKLLELTSQSAQGDIGGSGASVGGRPLYE